MSDDGGNCRRFDFSSVCDDSGRTPIGEPVFVPGATLALVGGCMVKLDGVIEIECGANESTRRCRDDPAVCVLLVPLRLPKRRVTSLLAW